MNPIIITKNFAPPPVNRKEILRYAKADKMDTKTAELLESCLSEALEKLCYKTCYVRLGAKISENLCDFGNLKVESSCLAKELKDCDEIFLFAATLGIELDRLIAKYGRISPSRALFFQAIGAERIESLCDSLCCFLEEESKKTLKPRFSAGYGDLDISCQSDIFNLLDCPKRIGLTLNDSQLMSPTKSVTAFVGIKNL